MNHGQEWGGEERRGHGECPSPGCAQSAAEQAVKQVFAILGVNIDNPSEVEQFRELLRFVKSVKSAAGGGMTAFLGALAVILAGWVVSKFYGH